MRPGAPLMRALAHEWRSEAALIPTLARLPKLHQLHSEPLEMVSIHRRVAHSCAFFAHEWVWTL
jgi:hypothetical protein